MSYGSGPEEDDEKCPSDEAVPDKEDYYIDQEGNTRYYDDDDPVVSFNVEHQITDLLMTNLRSKIPIQNN